MPKSGLSQWIRAFCRLLPPGAALAIACLASVTFLSDRSQAQQVPQSSDPTQVLRSILQGPNAIDNSGLNTVQPPQNTNPMTFLPALPNQSSLPPSRLEQIMSRRASVTLSQFGYDLVGSGQPVVVPQTGGVADDYILGPGDQIVVSFRGQENSEYTISVDRNGTVVLPRMPPINVSGRTLGEFRQQLAQSVKRAYVSTQAFASIGQLRQISVIVSGEVYIPGARLLTGLLTPLDAILLSGGIKKTGSLRHVILVRGGQRISVDLYNLLTQRGGGHIDRLTDGDKIIVPPIGRTVAVTGWVRTPGIFELAPGTAQISSAALLKLAGGLEVRGRYRLSVLRFQANGVSNLESLPAGGGTVRDSEILFVQPGADQTQQQATLSGGTPLAGAYSVGRAGTLASILKAPGALGTNPYTLFGVVSRRDPATMLRSLIPITPIAVVRGNEDMNLVSDDIVRVFSDDENRLITAVVDAFRLRRQAAEEALRAPAAGVYNSPPPPPTLSALPATTPTNGSPTDAASLLAAPKTQTPQPQINPQSNQTNTNPTPNTERQDIAELSVQTLGDGGVLTNNSPTNGYMPYGTQSNQNFGSNSVNSINAQAAAVLAAQQQGSQPAQTSGSQSQRSANLNADTSLPPNMQQQQVVAGQVPTNEGVQTFGQLARQLNVDPLVLVHFLMDHSLTIDGAVHGPGTFLVGPDVTLADLVTGAGGTVGWVDARSVELVTTAIDQATGSARTTHQLVALNDPAQARTLVKPRDEIRLHQIDTVVGAGSVTLQGQVRYPGTYQFERGERLSELLLRAGGLTDVAYPYGTVFLRKSAADIERQSYARAARDLENQVAAGMTVIGSDKVPPTALSDMQAFIYELRNTTPLGRITVTADPALLASDPSHDILLESGDVIYIPQRSSTVSVMGEVLQPGAFPARPNMSVKDYLDRAGGYSQFADDSLTFVVLPDGTARQADSSWLNFDNPNIPPGSTIVVPRNAAILDTRQIILDITGIFRDLAVGAASLAVISRN